MKSKAGNKVESAVKQKSNKSLVRAIKSPLPMGVRAEGGGLGEGDGMVSK